MSITEHELWALLLGAAIGSIVAYWYATRNKRFVSGVRSEIETLGRYHKLTPRQDRETQSQEIATYEEILALHPWAERISGHYRERGAKLSPARITAEAIICEKLLGLSRLDGASALARAKTLDDLRIITLRIRSKEVLLNQVGNVERALRKLEDAENRASHEAWIEEGSADAEAARQKAVPAASEAVRAVNKLHHFEDFVEKEKMPSFLFSDVKDVWSAVEAKCHSITDVSLLSDVADALDQYLHDGPSAPVLTATDVAPIRLGFGVRGHIMVATGNGETRALSSVLRKVLSAWTALVNEQ